MNPQNHQNQTDDQARGGARLGEYVLIAVMIVFVVVALGVATSFELAAIFSTSLGALIMLAAAGARLLESQEPAPQTAPRLLRRDDEAAAAKS